MRSRTRTGMRSAYLLIGGLVTVILSMLQLRVVHQHTFSSQVVNSLAGGLEGLLSKRHYSGYSANTRSLSFVKAVKAPDEAAASAEPKAAAATDHTMNKVRDK